MNRNSRAFSGKATTIVALAVATANSATDAAFGQISVDATMLTDGYTQNFDSMGTSGTANLPSGWKMTAAGAGSSAGWSTAGNLTAVNLQANSGSPTAAGRYNWGSSTTDRAAGFMTSGSYASPNGLLFGFTNVTTSTITGLTLGFDYERYRINTAAANVTFFTSTDGSTWTALTAGDSGSFATGTSSYTFSDGTIVNKSGISLSDLNIGQNQSYYLKWNFNTTGSNSQGIGLDNFSASFTSSGGGGGGGANYYWVGNDTTLGGSGTWAQTGGTAWRQTDTDGTGDAWDSSKIATFGGPTAGTVTVTDTVNADAGLSFATSGYTFSGGTISLGGANAAANVITTNAATAITVNSGLAGSTGLTKAGPGTLTLSAANTLSGGVTISGGALVVAGAAALGDNAVTINGGTLSTDATPRTISNAITFTGDGGLAADGSANLQLDGTISFGSGSRTVTVGSGATATLAGTFGTGGVIKAGSGTLVLGNAASLTGLGVAAGTLRIAEGFQVTTSSQPTISGGTLEVNGTLRIASTSASVSPAGSLTVGASGVVIQEGNGSPSNFLFGGSNYSWVPGSTFVLRDFTSTPTVSNRNYAMNLRFESSGSPVAVGAISGGNPWTVQGDLTIGEDVNFNYGTYTGTITYSGNVIVGGVLGATNGARSFTIGSDKELRLVNAGTLSIASGQTVTISGGVRSAATAGQTSTISGGTLSLGDATRTFDVAAGTGSAGLSISSGITNGGLSKTGSGRLTLAGTNSFAGGTTVSAGTLSISSDAGLGDASGGITLGGGTLEMTSGFTLGSGRTIAAAASTTSTLTVTSGTVTYGGAFTGSGDLDKAGAGTLSVSNTSSGYSGQFTISAGTLEVTGANAFPNATLTQTGGTLLVSPTEGGDVVLPEIGGDGGTVSIDSGANAVFSGNSNRSYNGQINGQGGLKKQGSGELTLNGNNGFTGATRIEAGRLKLGVGGSLSGTSEILVDDGAIFDATSKSSGLALGNGQRLGGRGTFLGDVEFGSGSALAFDGAGPLLLGSGTVSFAAGFGIGNIFGLSSGTPAGTYTLLDETAGGSINLANLANVGSGAAFVLGGGKTAYFQQGSLQVVVVPEPNALLLGGLGLALAGFRGWKRRRTGSLALAN